jgi:hypothetical protein
MNPFSELAITEPSKVLYQRNLSLILGKGYKSLDGLSDMKKVMEYVNTKKSHSTQRTYISSIITALKDKPQYDEIRRQYQIILKNDVHEQFNDTKTDKQKDNWVELGVLQKLLENKQIKLFKDIKAQKKEPLGPSLFNDLTAHMVCCLYLLSAPRRNKDYAQMYIGTGTDIDKNYYDSNKNTFKFINFKTNRTYNTQTINIPANLQDVLKVYMKYHSKTNPKFILFYNEQELQLDGDIKNILSAYLGTKIGVSLLRNIYASSIMKEDKKELQQLISKIDDVATMMGTSSTVLINQYTKK